jgi:hypothetical protein
LQLLVGALQLLATQAHLMYAVNQLLALLGKISMLL